MLSGKSFRTQRKPMIAVIGQGRNCAPKLVSLAEEVGRLIAKGGALLLCGGLGGIMEAVCRGAKECDGTTIGILPTESPDDANPFVDIPIATGMGEARNVIICRSADVVIAIGGFYGTLSEIAYSLAFDKPIIGLLTWKIDPSIVHVNSAEEAVERAFAEVKPS